MGACRLSDALSEECCCNGRRRRPCLLALDDVQEENDRVVGRERIVRRSMMDGGPLLPSDGRNDAAY